MKQKIFTAILILSLSFFSTSLFAQVAPGYSQAGEDTLANFDISSNVGQYTYTKSITVDYSVPKNGNAKLKIKDLQGNEVTTLFDNFNLAGIYHGQIDMGNLPSGAYVFSFDYSSDNNHKYVLNKLYIISQ